MQTINLSLTLDEVNFILESLGQMPYIKVNNLINKIQQQGASQLQKEEAGAIQNTGAGLINSDDEEQESKEALNAD